jgi:hypothetical protein
MNSQNGTAGQPAAGINILSAVLHQYYTRSATGDSNSCSGKIQLIYYRILIEIKGTKFLRKKYKVLNKMIVVGRGEGFAHNPSHN